MSLAPHTRVRITAGSAAGMEGVVRSSEDGLVTVEVTVFGRATTHELPPDQLTVLVDPAAEAAALLARRAVLSRTAHAEAWWAHEAPEDPAAAAAALPAAEARWEGVVAAGTAQAEAWLDENGPDIDALKATLRQLLPCPLLSEGEARALRQGRVTAGGAPRLTDAEQAERDALQARARAREAAAREAADGGSAGRPPTSTPSS